MTPEHDATITLTTAERNHVLFLDFLEALDADWDARPDKARQSLHAVIEEMKPVVDLLRRRSCRVR